MPFLSSWLDLHIFLRLLIPILNIPDYLDFLKFLKILYVLRGIFGELCGCMWTCLISGWPGWAATAWCAPPGLVSGWKKDDLNNRMNCTRIIWRKWWIHPILQIDLGNWIISIPQTAAMTFSSLFILLLWLKRIHLIYTFHYFKEYPTCSPRFTSVPRSQLLFWGKTTAFFTPPPPFVVSSRHQYRSEFDWLILK